MSKHHFAFFFFFLASFWSTKVPAQDKYTLHFPEPGFALNSKIYCISEVHDQRGNSSENGKILNENGAKMPVHFEKSMQESLNDYIRKLSQCDSNLVPVYLVIEKLVFTDAGTLSKHTLSLSIKLSLRREIEGREFVLYETSGNPNYISKGYTAGLADSLLLQVINPVLRSFDQWVNENPSQQTLCRKTEVSFIYDESYSDYSLGDTIRWNKDYKLKWEDFQGKTDKSSPFSAQSNCMFSFKTRNDYKDGIMHLYLYLYPCFTKKTSWVVPSNKQDGLLRHEQLHFDICELYIRRLRSSIMDSPLSLLDPSKQINDKFNQAWNEYQSAQAEYDEETQHGLIEKAQAAWTEKIALELNQLEDFASE